MKKILKITLLLIACVLIVGVSDVNAQYGKKKKKKPKNDDTEYFDESGGFKHKLWYGGGFTLGYAGNNNQSVFAIGVSPMVGYKITENLSFGPRVILDYTTRRFDDGFGTIYKAKNTSFGGGVFGRFKAFQGLFLHTEFELLNESLLIIDGQGNIQVTPGSTDLPTTRQVSESFYIGAGYNSGGGGPGYEILLLYNLLAPDNVVDLPIELRFGFTWNF